MEKTKPHSARAWAFGLDHVWHAFFWSMAGFRSALRHEVSFRIEAVLFVFLAPVALWLGGTGVERALLLGSLLLVLVVELLNSAVEAAIDRISDEHHKLSKRAKDLGSAAVFLCLVNAWATWLLVLWDRFLA
jgi:diacylglycerol kinase (ATP)